MKFLLKIIVSFSALVIFNGLIIASSVAEALTYEYDALGRLIRVTHADGQFVTYDYDPLGNRETLTTGIASTKGSSSNDIDAVIITPKAVQRDTDNDNLGDIWEPVISREGVVSAGGMSGLRAAVFTNNADIARGPTHNDLQNGQPD